jgi:hypothetical protein
MWDITRLRRAARRVRGHGISLKGTAGTKAQFFYLSRILADILQITKLWKDIAFEQGIIYPRGESFEQSKSERVIVGAFYHSVGHLVQLIVEPFYSIRRGIFHLIILSHGVIRRGCSDETAMHRTDGIDEFHRFYGHTIWIIYVSRKPVCGCSFKVIA